MNVRAAARRGTTMVGAASSIGIRPYDEGGEPRYLDQAPGVLRELGVVAQLGATDLGDVTPAAYRDCTRQPGRVRNEEALVTPLAGHPHALGLQITIYDPRLDPDRSCAKRLVTFLETIFRDRRRS